MDKYCVSLELAKELYQKGIVKNAEYWWVSQILNEKTYFIKGSEFWQTEHGKRQHIEDDCKKHVQAMNKVCPAPIAEELLELMPLHITPHKEPHSISVVKMYVEEDEEVRYFVVLVNDGIGDNAGEWREFKEDPKLSDALAKMLIWLHENGYLNV